MYRVIFLAITLLCGAATATAAATAERDKLTLAGPATIVSYPLFRMIETGALDNWAEKVSFRHWQNPDQLRAMVLSGDVDITAVPTNVAAIFYNRGEPVKLLNVSVWNLLWLVSRDPNVKGLNDLSGQTIMIPFRNDMPDIVFRLLASQPDKPAEQQYQLRYTASAMDIVQLLLSGRQNHAILPEPAVSMLLMKNAQQGKEKALHRAVHLAQPWQQRFPETPRMPQAGLMATRTTSNDPVLQQAIVDAYAEGARWCTNEPDACARLAKKHLPHLPLKAAAEAIRRTDLIAKTSGEARAALELFFNQIAQQNPARIGGKLPDNGFYLP